MPAQIVHLLPAVDQLIKITGKTDSLSTIQSEACRIASDAGSQWPQIQAQLRKLQDSVSIEPSQKLLLASCERYFMAYHDGYENHRQSYHAALPLLAHAQPKAVVNLLVSNAKCCASAGDFEQSLNFLIIAFDRAKQQPTDELYWPIFSGAVFSFDRMGFHRQALKYAQHCLFLANRNSNLVERQLSRFKVLNTARLNNIGSTQQIYQLLLRLREGDQLGYDPLNQFLLPVCAALESIESPQPNCRTACHNLSIAREQSHNANDYGIKQYLLALSLYHLSRGQRQQAKDAIVEAACLMHDADLSLTRRIREIHYHLGLSWQSDEAVKIIVAEQQTLAYFHRLSADAIRQSWRTEQYTEAAN